MRAISAALKAHYALGTTTVASCWKATLQDGTVLGATTYIAPLVIDGVTYEPTTSFNASDIESASDLSYDNLEIDGVLASPSVVAADLASGRWDYAEIELFEVNYRDLSMGKNIVRKGRLGELRAGRSSFTAELRGVAQHYSRRIIELTSKECRADLGDSRCQVNLASWTVSAAVTTTTQNKFITSTGLPAVGANYFVGGKLTFTSGLNDGLSMEVKANLISGSLELMEPMPFAVAVGDGFEVYRGCQKRLLEDCRDKFNNVINFRGEPYLPGSSVYGGPA